MNKKRIFDFNAVNKLGERERIIVTAHDYLTAKQKAHELANFHNWIILKF